MSTRRLVAAIAIALCGATAAGFVRAPAPYRLQATRSCLAGLPGAIDGLPPATAPDASAVFIYEPTRKDIPAWGEGMNRPRPYRQLDAWYGRAANYDGVMFDFFASPAAARASLKDVAWLYGGEVKRNVVVTWYAKVAPTNGTRKRIVACLSSAAGGLAVEDPTPPATLATLAGSWGGHTRGLSITRAGRGTESASEGCCQRAYSMAFRVLTIKGTVTQAIAMYRVVSFKRYDSTVKSLRPGELGRLVLKDGILTDASTEDFFCSDPAWGVTGACGA